MTNEEKLAKLMAVLTDEADVDEDEEDDGEDPDDFNPCDAYGGNFDDAFEGGKEKGRKEFARELLDLLI